MSTALKPLTQIFDEMSKTKKIFFYIALMLTSIAQCADFVIGVIAVSLYEAFPESELAVNFIITGPYLFLFIMSFIVPFLLKVTTKRVIIVVGMAVWCVTSIFGAAIESLPWLIACRSLQGCCNAAVTVCAMGLITDCFEDEAKRGKILGYYNVVMTLLGTIMSTMAGILALDGWANSFNIFWIGALTLILVIFFIPKSRNNAMVEETPQEKVADAAVEAVESRGGFGFSFWMMIVVFALSIIGFALPFAFYPSVFIEENGLGDSAFTGMAVSASTIAGMVGCFLFGYLFKVLKARVSIIYYAGILVALLIAYFGRSSVTYPIAMCIGNFCYSSLVTYVFAEGPLLVHPSKSDRALSFVNMGSALMNFVLSYIMTGIQVAMGTELITPLYPVFAVLMVIAVVLEVIRTRK